MLGKCNLLKWLTSYNLADADTTGQTISGCVGGHVGDQEGVEEHQK